MTTLIIGGSGFLGTELIRQAKAAGHRTVATYHATAPAIASDTAWYPLDLRDPERMAVVAAEVRPRLIINASSGGADWATTAEAPVRLAVIAKQHGSHLVQVSTDAVFSGISRSRYDETCLPDPITPYGAAKAAAETGILVVHPEAAVVRTSLIIGHGRSVHEHLVHRLAAGTTDGVLFTDDVRCPVHVSDLAAALLELAESGAAGVHHAAGSDAVSRHELGVLIARSDGLDASQLPAGLRAQDTAPGALDVRLDSRKTQESLRIRLRGAYEFLGLYEDASGPSHTD
ncbi:sugar nucleotide-binding protein [Streptomyces sp. NBC_00441]|uniref:SDR family oxidoreductase n=1 Tax=Streptomyces sp. NBC_00441 TaxID=2975742 RepID=UPI002E2B1C29|nr:sugar nucleotide-binding protein [Streptomyces sp. NBC_00441]